jgi:hypothetical protein
MSPKKTSRYKLREKLERWKWMTIKRGAKRERWSGERMGRIRRGANTV